MRGWNIATRRGGEIEDRVSGYLEIGTCPLIRGLPGLLEATMACGLEGKGTGFTHIITALPCRFIAGSPTPPGNFLKPGEGFREASVA